MASISHDKKTGRRTIQFVAADGKRKSVRLGSVSKRQAETTKGYIEDLLACRITGSAPSKATADWLAELPRVLRRRIEKAGLVNPQEQRESLTLGEWLARYMEDRRDTVTKGTEVNCEQARDDLLACFGADKPLRTFTAGDGEKFRQSLERKKLAVATVRRRCGRARQFFTAAFKRELIGLNPFDGVPCKSVGNQDRLYFVKLVEIEAVIAACPSAEWRLIFALCRYGGLRCPSEVLPLRWSDVNWERMRFTVRSPKTIREGKSARDVPIFPELYPHLLAAFEQAEEGQDAAFTQHSGPRRNLRTQALRIIRQAGLTPWAKVFQNCRSSRETELVEDYSIKAATSWLGNSPQVAVQHYLQVREEDWQKAVHNPVQQAHGQPRTVPQLASDENQNQGACSAMRKETALCENTEPSPMTPRRLELRLPG